MASPEVFMFPGQGSQHVGMGRSLESSALIGDVFAEADEVLQRYEWWKRPVRDICLAGPKEILNDTIFAQPAILTVSIAALRELIASGNKIDAVIGHSLAEYSALVAADSMSLADAVAAVAQRGRIMKDVADKRPGAMVAIIGLALAEVNKLCRRLIEETPGANVQIANKNSPRQVIIAGDREALRYTGEVVKEFGTARAIMLPVTIAGHCELMRPAQEDMEHLLDSIPLKSPVVPFYSPTTKTRVEEPEAIRALLVAQLTSPVEWVETVRFMVSSGFRYFREVGPGKVLSGLVRDIDPTVEVSSTNT